MSKKVALVDDEPLIRESVEAFICAKTTHEVMLSCGSVESFLEELDATNLPEILFLDIGLPGLSGIEGIPKILEKAPDIDIIMLSTYEETEDIYNALCAGACSYVSKRSSPLKVIDALNVVAAGGAYMSPSIAKKISAYFMSLNKKPKVELSVRQMEIIKLMANGIPMKEIAEQCFISHNTVKTHVKRIYQILNINCKADLLKKYFNKEI
jgi:DNA-binding NarL/FixJ family response regulator